MIGGVPLKERKLLWFSVIICIVVILAVLPVIGGCTQPSPAPKPTTPTTPTPTPKPQPIVLKAVSFLPVPHPTTEALKMLIDKVNKKAKGDLVIDLLGGPEVVPPLDLPGAVKKGSIHLALCPAEFCIGLAPGIERLHYTEVTEAEERTNGAYALKVELFGKGGLFYLGLGQARPQPHGYFRFHLNKQIARPQDIAGLKIGKGTVALTFLKYLGASSVTLQMNELYGAMESNVVNGLLEPTVGWAGQSGESVTKYMYNPMFLNPTLVNIMHPATWNQIPKNLQNLLIEAQIEGPETEFLPVINKQVKDADQKMIKAGVKVIDFSPEDGKWMVDTCYRVEWEETIRMYPDVGPKLMDLLVPRLRNLIKK